MTLSQTHDQKARALEHFLVASARVGDRPALERLVRLTSPRLLAHAARLMGDADAARDIVQSAWIDIIRGLPTLRETAAFRAFAQRIVTRKVAAQIRGRQRDRTLASAFANEAVHNTAPLGDLTADAATVRAAIDALPAAHRVTLSLFYLDDLTISEVAAVLHVPVGTIKTRLMHARAKLRAHLEGNPHDKDR